MHTCDLKGKDVELFSYKNVPFIIAFSDIIYSNSGAGGKTMADFFEDQRPLYRLFIRPQSTSICYIQNKIVNFIANSRLLLWTIRKGVLLEFFL